jgi:hypothetical protein
MGGLQRFAALYAKGRSPRPNRYDLIGKEHQAISYKVSDRVLLVFFLAIC